jgi:hypothetical protein
LIDRDCEFEAQAVFSEEFVPCGDDTEFKLTEGQLIIWRGWDSEG